MQNPDSEALNLQGLGGIAHRATDRTAAAAALRRVERGIGDDGQGETS